MINKKLDITYFKTINTSEKAYWLGFLYADGCVTSNHKATIIELSKIDKYHLEKFNNCIQSDYPISDRENSVRLAISRKEFAEYLINDGCIPRKSLILTFPDESILSKQFIKYFILGYFDGDGCLSTILHKHKNRPNPCMICELNMLGTYDMLFGILSNLPIEMKIIRKETNIYKFRISNKKEIIKILDYLYEDSPIYLERKHKKYIENIKMRETPRYKII